MAEKPKSKPIKMGDHSLTHEQLEMIRHCMNTTIHMCKKEGKIDPDATRELMFIVLSGSVKTELLYATLDVQLHMREKAKGTQKQTVH